MSGPLQALAGLRYHEAMNEHNTQSRHPSDASTASRGFWFLLCLTAGMLAMIAFVMNALQSKKERHAPPAPPAANRFFGR